LGPVAFLGAAVLSSMPSIRSAMPTSNYWWSVGIPLVIFVPNFVAVVLVWSGRRRIRRAVRASGGRACTYCVHDLSGLGDTGTCPECGHAFDAAADARRWARVHMSP
jgi:hypothetical protein